MVRVPSGWLQEEYLLPFPLRFRRSNCSHPSVASSFLTISFSVTRHFANSLHYTVVSGKPLNMPRRSSLIHTHSSEDIRLLIRANNSMYSGKLWCPFFVCYIMEREQSRGHHRSSLSELLYLFNDSRICVLVVFTRHMRARLGRSGDGLPCVRS